MVIELKNATNEGATIWNAFQQLQNYKQQISSLFVYNAALVISDGVEARMGTLTSNRERFLPWRTVDGQVLAPATMPQLQVLIRGVLSRTASLTCCAISSCSRPWAAAMSRRSWQATINTTR